MKGLVFLLTLSIAYAEIMQCVKDFTEITKRSSTMGGSDPYSLMALYSGLKRNSLGDYTSCADLDYADYLMIGFSASPIVVMTMCGSKNCTEEDYRIIFSSATPQAGMPLHDLIENSFTNDFKQEIRFTLAHYQSMFQEFAQESSTGILKHLAEPLIQKTYGKSAILNDKSVGAGVFVLPIFYPQDYIEDHFNALTPGAIIMLIFCSMLIGITLAGTALDIVDQKMRANQAKQAKKIAESINIPMNSTTEISYSRLNDSETMPAETSIVANIMICFSLYTNGKKLFMSRSSEKTGSQDTLDIFNGVRVMSMGWVVLGHVFLIKFTNTPLVNFQDAANWYKHPKGAMIYGAEYAVDVFFWLSGFLVAYFFIMEYNAKNKMNWVHIYIHRFYRILPAYMFCLLLTWSFTKYIGNGPMWITGDSLNHDCKNYWYTNMIFLNNFIPDGDGSGCMGWSWYMANDMQFFLITPVILFLYHKIHRLIGWGILVGLVLTNFLCSALIANDHDYPVAPDKTFQKIYVKPYCRVGPYAVGIMFGLIYFTYKHHQKTGKVYDPIAKLISDLFNIRILRYISYLLGLFLINYLIFIQVEAYHDYYESIENGSTDPQDYWSQNERNTFYALSRTGYVVGLSLILMPILMGHNKLACRFLGHSVWTPLARLSFCGYLIHYGLVYAILVSNPVAGYFSDTELFYDFIVCLILTYLAALPISLVMESPFMAIEKLFKGLPRETSKRVQPQKKPQEQELR